MGDTLSIKVYQALASALEMSPGRRVILSDSGNFPSDLYMAEGLCRTLGDGYVLKTVAPEAVEAAIDETVAVTLITEVDYRTGRRHDMAAITAAAHAKGAQIILVRNEGWTMDDCCGAEMEAAWVEFCYANRVMAEDLRAKAEARIAERWRQAVVDQAQVEARRNLRRGEVVQKNGRICTRCYSCAGNKQTSWEDGGQRARPTTLHVSSECFTHAEFVAGRIRDDCPFLHQGDEGWHREWDRNFLWDPSAPTVTPLARRVCATEDSRLFCISEKSAGYLPVHLGGRPDGPDART
jgi:hypothetical protein